MTPAKKTKLKKGVRLASYGAAGNIAGTVAGAVYGKNTKAASKVGTAAGLAVGGWRQSRQKGSVPSQKKSVGDNNFKRRVGTKTQGRIGKTDHPFNVQPRKTKGVADAGVSY